MPINLIAVLAVTLLCVLLLNQQIAAEASNKQSTQEIDDTKDDLVAAEDRISDSYLPPPSSRYSGPKPVYGPPELTGVQPQQVYEAPPAEQPPPRSNAPIPFSSYGPPSKPKPQYGPPKPQYGPPSKPKPQYGPPKPHYGPPQRPPKPQYGPPKPQYGPPSRPPRPPKPQYGPPKPQYGPPKPEYGPPKVSSPAPQYDVPVKIPLTVETYGPPTKQSTIDFQPKPHDTYGPPPQQSQPSLPQQQYGAPNNDLYGPPPPPPPGVAAPPTPPEIKYDGWQPIAGQAQRPSDSYGPPPSAPSNEYGPPESQPHQEYGPPPSPSQPALPQQQYGPPSDEYGPPPPPSQPSFPPRQSFRPPSDEYGPPPPPSQPSFPPRQQYGPPSKPQQTYGPPPSRPHQEYGPPPPPPQQQPSLPQQQYGPPANEYGPPPPQQQPSLPQQQYGPPANEYGPPPPQQQPSLPQQQYGPPANEYGPPPSPPQQQPQQQYGPPANEYGPPPPPQQQPQQQYGPPANEYGSPPAQQQPSFPPSTIITDNFAAPKQQYIPTPIQIISDPKVPSDSYGTPLNNPEDHNLKSTVSQSTKTHDGDGLPPPDLPQFEPLHNNQGPIDSNNIGFGEQLGLHTDNLAVVKSGYHLAPSGVRPGNSYAPPSFNDLSIQQLPAPSGGYNAPAFAQGGGGNNYFNRFNRKGLRRGPFPPAPHSVFTPPRRPPTQFRDSIPKGIYSNPQNAYAPPSSANQQVYPVSQSSVAFFGSQNFLAAHPEFLGKSNGNFGSQSGFGNYNSQAGGGNSYNSLDSHLAASVGSVAVQGVNDCDTNAGSIYQQQSSNDHAGDSQSAYSMPNVSQLELQQHPQQQQQQQSSGHDQPKDSYGNPIVSADNFGAPDQSGVQAATADNNNNQQQQQQQLEFSDVNGQNSLSGNYDGLTAEQLTAALTAQGYGEAKNIVKSSEIDSTQYLSSQEGQQALALTQQANNDGFQIQGSQGTYTLQIQAADGHFNADGSNDNGDIRHEQILSNGLLQNILAAIEQQPDGAQIEVQGVPQQSGYDLSHAASSSSVVTNQAGESSQSAEQQQQKSSSSDQDSSASSSNVDQVMVFLGQAGTSGEKQEEIASSDKGSTENMKSS
ncbi:hypothetical protein TKK_0007381 [Trichogramma kaykai]